MGFVKNKPWLMSGYVCVKCGVAPTQIAGVQKPWMALNFHVLVTWIPAISAGMTALISFQRLTRTVL